MLKLVHVTIGKTHDKRDYITIKADDEYSIIMTLVANHINFKDVRGNKN